MYILCRPLAFTLQKEKLNVECIILSLGTNIISCQKCFVCVENMTKVIVEQEVFWYEYSKTGKESF
jgi:hypothetical protein